MNSLSIEKVNNHLKKLPESSIVEIEKYLEFLVFKKQQETHNIPEWHKEIVLNRLENQQTPIDAFEMIDEIENEK